LLRQLGRDDEDLPYYQKAVELDPLAPVLAVNLAYGLWGAGQLEEAKDTLFKSLSINPDSAAELLEELKEVVATQRQWYLDLKDEPLF
jgi:tetratricopeptide (TPR) repeat protein